MGMKENGGGEDDKPGVTELWCFCCSVHNKANLGTVHMYYIPHKVFHGCISHDADDVNK